jgi:hypothetical protein
MAKPLHIMLGKVLDKLVKVSKAMNAPNIMGKG